MVQGNQQWSFKRKCGAKEIAECFFKSNSASADALATLCAEVALHRATAVETIVANGR